MPLQIRRGTQAERSAMTVPLASGELLYVTDDQRLYVGNGSTLGGVQITGYNDEDAQEATAKLLLGSSPLLSPDNSIHTGITFSFDDNANRLSATVNFESVATLEADAFKGSLFADDSTLLVDGLNASINLNGTVKGNILPNANESYDIGSPLFKFKDLYLSGTSLYLGDAQITAVGSSVNLPAGSTVGGVTIGAITGSVQGDLYGSVFADDSTVLVDSIKGELSTAGIIISTDQVTGLNEIYSFNADPLRLFSATGTSQTQVVFPVVAATPLTGTEILSAANDWKFVGILGSKDSLTPSLDLVAGDVLGVFGISGRQANGTDMGAVIGAQVDPNGTPTASWVPTKLFFGNTPDNSSAVTAPLMTFDSFGQLAVNQENAQATVDINGTMRLVKQTSAPVGAVEGTIAVADGLTAGWDPKGTNLGVSYPCYYDGSVWTPLF